MGLNPGLAGCWILNNALKIKYNQTNKIENLPKDKNNIFQKAFRFLE